jgi:hypothetical protein
LPLLPKLVIAGIEKQMIEDRYNMEQGREQGQCRSPVANLVPEARYSYYRRCQVFRRSGEQCKAPAEKGQEICHAHAGQLARAVRRELQRRAVLAEAVAEMRRRGKPECQMADLLTDFNGIQVTLAVMAQALIDGRIDCKTAGQLLVHLQTMSKLLWMMQGKRKTKPLPLIKTDNTDLNRPSAEMNSSVASAIGRASGCEGEKVLQFERTAFVDRSQAHGPPQAKAA